MALLYLSSLNITASYQCYQMDSYQLTKMVPHLLETLGYSQRAFYSVVNKMNDLVSNGDSTAKGNPLNQ